MNNFKWIVSVMAIAALASTAGCKKKDKPKTTGGSAAMGSAGSAGGMMGSAGSGMAGSDSMAGSAGSAAEPPKSKALVNMLPADLKWMPMDEKAGDKGPMFAVLWGDPMSGPNGFMIKAPAGMPGIHHTHTGDYHGVAVSGASTHAMDGGKKAETLPAPLSYWMMPGGAAHTSACPGKEECMMLVHFNEGKMDFAPAEMKKDGKPDPRHVEKRAKDLKWMPLIPDLKEKSPQVATAWGDPQSGPSGFYLKFSGKSPPHTHTADYHGVVLEGTVMNYVPDDKAPKEMPKGGYWFQPGGVSHITECKAKECIMYGYILGKFDSQMDGTPPGGAGSAAAGSAGGAMKGGDMKGGDMKGHDGHDHGKGAGSAK